MNSLLINEETKKKKNKERKKYENQFENRAGSDESENGILVSK